MEGIKKLQKDGLSEDEAKVAEARVQAMTDKKMIEIDNHCSAKEKELMTV
jgi:ribosome recycling factor